MATKVTALRSVLVKTVIAPQGKTPMVQQIRRAVTTDTGAFLEKPEQTRFGLLKAAGVTIPFLWAGATLSKNGAAFLEENDIFVPDDDDD